MFPFNVSSNRNKIKSDVLRISLSTNFEIQDKNTETPHMITSGLLMSKMYARWLTHQYVCKSFFNLIVRKIIYNKTRLTNLKRPAVWGMRLLNIHYDEICDVGKIANNFTELSQLRQKWSSAWTTKIYDQGASTLWRFQKTKTLLAIYGKQRRVVGLGTEFCLLVYVQKNESPQTF